MWINDNIDNLDKHIIRPPASAAFELWGWALMRQYHADAGVIEWAQVLPDPDPPPLERTRVQPRRAGTGPAAVRRR